MGLDGETDYQPVNHRFMPSPKESGQINVEGHRCPYCHDNVVAGDKQGRQFCCSCGALHHKSCLEEVEGKCATCRQKNSTLVVPVSSSAEKQTEFEHLKSLEGFYEMRMNQGKSYGISSAVFIAIPVIFLFYTGGDAIGVLVGGGVFVFGCLMIFLVAKLLLGSVRKELEEMAEVSQPALIEVDRENPTSKKDALSKREKA